MVTYTITVMWTNGGGGVQKGFTWAQVQDYLTGLYQTAMNESVKDIVISNEQVVREFENPEVGYHRRQAAKAAGFDIDDVTTRQGTMSAAVDF